MPQLWDWTQIRILHFQYEKPWQDHPKADSLRPLIDLWRQIAAGGPMPDLNALPGPPA